MGTRIRSPIVSTALLVALALTFIPALAQSQSANRALTFDGTSNRVSVPNNPLLELVDGTLELWFRPDWDPGSMAYDPVLIANQQGPFLIRYSLRVDRTLSGVILANGNTSSRVAHTFKRGEWVHVAVSESGPTAQVYVNGHLVGSTSNGFGTLVGLPLSIGSDGFGGFFQGQMDEVRIWRVPRTASDLSANLARSLTGAEPGLVAYWRMDEGAGALVIDASSNQLDGMIEGSTWAASQVPLINTSIALGMAVDFYSSRGTHVQVPSAPSLALTNQFTLEAWVKPRTTQRGAILSRGDGVDVAATAFLLEVGTDGTNSGRMNIALMAGGVWSSSASQIPPNVWSHIAVACDGATNRFYINGVLDNEVPAGGTLYKAVSPLFIGREGSAGTNYLDGTLDEVRVWDSARSGSEIATSLKVHLAGDVPGLVAYWRFNEQGSAQAADSSVRGNHGRLINRPVRVPSAWAPVITVDGAEPTIQQCHGSFQPFVASSSFAPVVVAPSTDPYGNVLVLSPDGSVTDWGNDPSHGGRPVPPSATNLIAVACGNSHSLVLRSDGTVVAWGDGAGYGQLNIPVSATNVVAIATAGFLDLALRADGTVVAWGYNADGQANVPSTATNIVAIADEGTFALGLRADGTFVHWGRSDALKIPASATNLVGFAVGFPIVGIRGDGSLVGWSSDPSWTPVPADAPHAVTLAIGYGAMLAVKVDGNVVGWGNNTYRILDIPPAATNVMGIAFFGGGIAVALREDGAVLQWGNGGAPIPSPPLDLGRLNSPIATHGTVNPNVPGTYVLTYTTTNAFGAVATATRTVIVVDGSPPVLSLLGSNPFNLDLGNTLVDPGVTASDACEGDLTGQIIRSGNLNPGVPGSYTLTYTVADSSGNTATTNRTLLVRSLPGVLGFNAFVSGSNPVTGSPVIQFVADVTPNGLPTTAFAQYGLKTTYLGRSTSVTIPAGYQTSSFFATLDGLVLGATYHFRVAASNSLGVAYGPDRTFTVPTLFAAGDLNGDGRVDAAELSSVLSNYWAGSSPLMMTNPAVLGDGLFQFAITNVTGWNLSVLASTNLADWELLSVPARPVWQFADPSGTNGPQRYYRLRWP